MLQNKGIDHLCGYHAADMPLFLHVRNAGVLIARLIYFHVLVYIYCYFLCDIVYNLELFSVRYNYAIVKSKFNIVTNLCLIYFLPLHAFNIHVVGQNN